jgi:hypothetical protein
MRGIWTPLLSLIVPEREYGVEVIVEKRCRILFIEKEEEWDGKTC